MGRVKLSKIIASLITLGTFFVSFFTFSKTAFFLAIPIFVITSAWIFDDITKERGKFFTVLKWTLPILTLVIIAIACYLTMQCDFIKFDEYDTTPMSLVYYGDKDASTEADVDYATPDNEQANQEKSLKSIRFVDRYIFSPRDNTFLYTENVKGFSYVWFARIFIWYEIILLVIDIIVDVKLFSTPIYESNDRDIDQQIKMSRMKHQAKKMEKQK